MSSAEALHAERPAARLHDLRLRDGESGAHDAGKQPEREPASSENGRPSRPFSAHIVFQLLEGISVRPQYLLRCTRADCQPGSRARSAIRQSQSVSARAVNAFAMPHSDVTPDARNRAMMDARSAGLASPRAKSVIPVTP
jgi:hypothetical protein